MVRTPAEHPAVQPRPAHRVGADRALRHLRNEHLSRNVLDAAIGLAEDLARVLAPAVDEMVFSFLFSSSLSLSRPSAASGIRGGIPVSSRLLVPSCPIVDEALPLLFWVFWRHTSTSSPHGFDGFDGRGDYVSWLRRTHA